MFSVFSLFKKETYKCFGDEVEGKKLKYRTYKGTKPIDVTKIVGSVGRCQRDNFLSVDKESHRYKNIKDALEKMKNLPAIQVYDVDEEYYIVDGHHRVEASKEIGKDFLDAEVIEYRYH
ncbi:MAG: ParB N-terminal domain-containing protein [Halanaerobiaceae bacterium]